MDWMPVISPVTFSLLILERVKSQKIMEEMLNLEPKEIRERAYEAVIS